MGRRIQGSARVTRIQPPKAQDLATVLPLRAVKLLKKNTITGHWQLTCISTRVIHEYQNVPTTAQALFRPPPHSFPPVPPSTHIGQWWPSLKNDTAGLSPPSPCGVCLRGGGRQRGGNWGGVCRGSYSFSKHALST